MEIERHGEIFIKIILVLCVIFWCINMWLISNMQLPIEEKKSSLFLSTLLFCLFFFALIFTVKSSFKSPFKKRNDGGLFV